MEKNIERFTILLRSLRAKNNLTQKYLAYQLGISQSQYNKLENGDTPITIDRIIKIAAIFNLDKKEFLKYIVDEGVDAGHLIENKQRTIVADDADIEYYKNLTCYLEKRFLKLYKKYVELNLNRKN